MTWQQILADEKLENIIPAVESICEEKKKLVEKASSIVDGCNFNFCDMHDAKMLCLLTQHSSWSRKNHPFLLCKCQRGEGVEDFKSHKCTLIEDDEQLKLHNRSDRSGKERLQMMKPTPQKNMQIGLTKRTLEFCILDCHQNFFEGQTSDLTCFMSVLQSPKD